MFTDEEKGKIEKLIGGYFRDTDLDDITKIIEDYENGVELEDGSPPLQAIGYEFCSAFRKDIKNGKDNESSNGESVDI